MSEKFRWIALWLAVICVVFFIVQFTIDTFTDEFVLVSSLVLEKPWTLLSSIFLHGSFEHLFYNMFALVMFGLILEKVIGTKNFITIFFAAGIFAGLGAILFYNAALGASGAIYGVMGSLAIVRPKMTVYMGFVPMPMIIAVSLWAAGDLIGLFAPGQVAHAAHLFGLIFGIIFTLLFLRKHIEIPRKRKEKMSNEELRKWEQRFLK